jgi:adenine-specific DNA-methyltransferase
LCFHALLDRILSRGKSSKPGRSAWENIARTLEKYHVMGAERFEAFSDTVSLPFPPGKHKQVAVKVIDTRGNEVMKVHRIGAH